MFDDLDLTKITGEHTREHVARLLNLIETLGADLRAAQAEIQRLRDEVNRLKGEQGKPSVKPGTKPTATDLEVEGEFGISTVHIENIPSENPRTGRRTALSIIRSLENAVDTVHVGT